MAFFESAQRTILFSIAVRSKLSALICPTCFVCAVIRIPKGDKIAFHYSEINQKKGYIKILKSDGTSHSVGPPVTGGTA